MDFTPTEATLELAGLARDILADHVTAARLRQVEASPGHVDRALWADLAEAGVLSAALPEDVGGGGFGLLEQCGVLVELGRAVAPVPYLPSIAVAASALAAFGTAEQREAWAKPTAAGELLPTAALVEELDDGTGTPATTAEHGPDGWTLTGAKTTVPWGAVADLFLVPATTSRGTAVFLVDPHDERVTVAGQRVVDGDDTAWLELAGVRLGEDRLLGSPGDGTARWLVARATVGLCALQLGITERALELTAEHARTRVQFDRPIGSFQAVSQRLADAFVDVAAIRLTLWQAAWRLASDLPCDTEVATAKFWAADAGHRVAHTAVHVHGGQGIDVEHGLHRYFTAAKRVEFDLGGATAHLRGIGAALAAHPA
ncbi:acyl-CoA dehydrogenase family protein [Umezawaea sp.]|uniref:acyl-CoA dehydrogenase family protein n=1 Tax=Umezawaea sp. TaxID=1955258 RepID=UPI002ED204CF